LSTPPVKKAGERHFETSIKTTPSSSDPTDRTKIPPVCPPKRLMTVKLLSEFAFW
jgi:hypothetical protein